MKTFRKLTLIMLLAMFGLAKVALAQQRGLPTSGTWGTTTGTTTAETQTVNLTGNINLKGTITIPSGKTLTINANGAPRAIKNDAGDGCLDNGMFYIKK